MALTNGCIIFTIKCQENYDNLQNQIRSGALKIRSSLIYEAGRLALTDEQVEDLNRQFQQKHANIDREFVSKEGNNFRVSSFVVADKSPVKLSKDQQLKIDTLTKHLPKSKYLDLNIALLRK